jgi:para-aminobenzoate synthetase component I
VIRIGLDVSPDRLAPVVGSWPGPALLESGPGFGDAGRWSILAAHPRLVFEATGSSWSIHGESQPRHSGQGRVLETLGGLLDRFGLASAGETPDPDAPPFQGGLIGFFGYDLAPLLERLPRKAPRDSRLPDVRFALYDTAVIVDHASGAANVVAADLLGEGRTTIEKRASAWCEALARPPRREASAWRLGPTESNFTKPGYLDAVRRLLEYIAAGDIFQVNLSQRFTAFGDPDPLDLYLRLKTRSPAPFGGFLAWDDLAVVSASPESFYQTRGDRIVTRPIKGTRPRGDTPEADARLQAELSASPKDRAELTMIVDLERNDLGRFCRYGTVKVVDPLTVESFAQVHHLVATVEGRIRPELGPVDVARAMFPGGSITGAPKIRAMEIIDELEPSRRGLYTGAVGYFSRGGASGFNIAIRTMIVEGGRVTYQVGGGIVADSDPENEYHETLHKGRGLREALGFSKG